MKKEKEKLIEKYQLILQDGDWYRTFVDEDITYKVFSKEFLETSDIFACVLKLNGLCSAKVGILPQYKDEIHPYIFRCNEWMKCEWWDCEFIYIFAIEEMVDLRGLHEIKKFSEFKKLLKLWFLKK